MGLKLAPYSSFGMTTELFNGSHTIKVGFQQGKKPLKKTP